MAPSIFAGTYSVVGVEWWPHTPTVAAGGYIRFGVGANGENPYDVHYGIQKHVHAPFVTGFSSVHHTEAYPAVYGFWRWKIRWVGAVGEPAPLGVNATVQGKGTGTVSTEGTTNTTGITGSGYGFVFDPFLGIFGCDSAQSTPGLGPDGLPHDADTASQQYTTQSFPTGITFAHVSGTTYEGYASYVVESIAELESDGYDEWQPFQALFSYGQANVNTAVTVRVTHVAGVRVQPDL
jgi:hypothetical protein